MEYKIITGANDSYILTLINFIKNHIDKINTVPLIIYDLGLSDSNKKIIEELIMGHHIIIKIFDYSLYPEHVNINTHNGLYCSYAFKPICIYNECIHEPTIPHLWLDSANLFSIDTVHQMIQSINTFGVYSPVGNYEKTIESIELNHPVTLQKLGLTEHEHYHSLQTRHACVVGVKYANPCGKNILDNWHKCSLQEDIIIPHGSSRNNHRQDQTVLSALMFLWEKENNMSFEKSNFNLSTNNKLDKLIISSEYHPYKLCSIFGNQLAIIYTKTIDEAIEVYSNRKKMNITDFLCNYSVSLTHRQ
jgi:hypothetical protein